MRLRSLCLLLLICTAACTTLQSGLSAPEEKLIREAGAARKSDPKAAIGKYQEAIGLSKGAVRAHLELAGLLREQGRAAEAIDILTGAAKLQPENTEVIKDLGNSYILSGDGVLALAQFDKAAALKKDDARLHNGRGVALDLLKRHDEAQAAYRTGIDLSPKTADYIRNNLALSLVQSGRYADALPMLEKLAGSEEATPQIRQNLSMAYALSGNEAKAREIARQDLADAQVEQNIAFYKSLVQQRAMAAKAPKVKKEAAVKTVKPAKKPGKKAGKAPPKTQEFKN